MRTIGEIIDAVQDGKKEFDTDELRLTVACQIDRKESP